jgi:hypothetical protein
VAPSSVHWDNPKCRQFYFERAVGQAGLQRLAFEQVESPRMDARARLGTGRSWPRVSPAAGKAKSRRKSPSSPSVQELYKEGRQLLAEGRCAEARGVSARMLEGTPTSKLAMILQGEVLLAEGHRREAEAIFSDLRRKHPRDKEVARRSNALLGNKHKGSPRPLFRRILSRIARWGRPRQKALQ